MKAGKLGKLIIQANIHITVPNTIVSLWNSGKTLQFPQFLAVMPRSNVVYAIKYSLFYLPGP